MGMLKLTISGQIVDYRGLSGQLTRFTPDCSGSLRSGFSVFIPFPWNLDYYGVSPTSWTDCSGHYYSLAPDFIKMYQCMRDNKKMLNSNNEWWVMGDGWEKKESWGSKAICYQDDEVRKWKERSFGIFYGIDALREMERENGEEEGGKVHKLQGKLCKCEEGDTFKFEMRHKSGYPTKQKQLKIKSNSKKFVNIF